MALSRDDQLEHLKKVATPSRFAMHAAMDVMGKPWVPHPWILFLERQILDMLARPGVEIMIVSVPPQQGKTTFVGMWLTSWYVMTHPDDQVIFISYNEEYSGSWGLRNRGIVERFGPELFNVELSNDQQAIGNWKTARNFGGMRSVGIMGGITGNPGHLIVIDDVIKTMEDAVSPTIKKKHIGEWDGSIGTRWQDNTKILLTATRWAEDDLSGEIIRRSREPNYNGPPVHEIKIKAIAEPSPSELKDMDAEQLRDWTDVLGRKFGESLKGQHSPTFFDYKKPPATDVFTWNSLYQGEPSARTGSMFPKAKWRTYDPSAPMPNFVAKRRIWDLATVEGAGDWTCGILVGKTDDNRYYVLDMQRHRMSSGDVKSLVRKTAEADGWTIPIRIEKERSGAGKSVVESYEYDLAGWDVGPAYAEGTKEQRAIPASGVQNVGKCYLPEDADWVEDFKEELEGMMGDGRRPNHDDQVDVFSYAVIEMMGSAEIEIQDPNEQSGLAEEAIQSWLDQLVV